MNIDSEIADEEIERDLRTWRDEQAIGVCVGVIEICGVARSNIKTQGIDLAHRPDGIQRHLRTDDHVLLGVRSQCDVRTEWRGIWSVDYRGSIFRIIDIVVVLDPDT